MRLTADLLGSAREDPTAIAAIAAGEIQCVLATPETLLNNPVHRNMPLSKVYRDIGVVTLVVTGLILIVLIRGCRRQPLYCFHFDFRYVTLVR